MHGTSLGLANAGLIGHALAVAFAYKMFHKLNYTTKNQVLKGLNLKRLFACLFHLSYDILAYPCQGLA